MAELRVLVVDDQRLLRESLAALLDAEPDLSVVGTAATGVEAIAEAARTSPDVILMDIRMPELDGIAATGAICRSQASHARVVLLTMFDHDEYVVAGLRAGASGFLLKDTPPQALIDGVRLVASGQALLSPAVLTALVASSTPEASGSLAGVLTDRQREVLALVARGASNDDIEARLSISRATVKTHIAALLQRLGARDRAQLVIAAYEAGLVRPGG